MEPVMINLSNFVMGDTWEGITVGPVLFNNTVPAIALASCRLYFRNPATKVLEYEFNSVETIGMGLIVISDPVAWVMSISEQALPLTAGIHDWKFKTTDAAGVIRTLYAGKLIVLEE